MSKIDELIEGLCPEGVEFRRLGEVCATLTPKIKIKAHDYLESGQYPVIDQGQEFIGGYTNEEGVFPMGKYVLFGDHTCTVKYIDFPFAQGADGLKVIVAHENILIPKFLYYCMCNIHIQADYARHWGKMKENEIPLPPLAVQEEIVRILDAFTSLEAELEAELEARKKQYAYYRDTLLSFDRDDPSVEWKLVSELYEFKNGLNKGKEFFGKGSPIVNFTDVYNNISVTKESLKGRVEVDEKEINAYRALKGDLFFTRTSETQEDIGMTCCLLDDIKDCVFSGFVLRARPKTNLLDPKFAAYYFSASHVRKQIVRYSSFTTRALTSGPKLGKIPIPIPPLSIQHRIAETLDKFEALTSDLQSGLPAEIEARRRQYEYYRDRLLSFKVK